MNNRHSRRNVFAYGAAVLGASLMPTFLEESVNAQTSSSPSPSPAPARPKAEPFGYCFNTATTRGQKLPIDQLVDIVAKAGWNGIEPWIDEITRYTEAGGSLKDLRKRIADGGLAVPSAIGFAEWIVDDPERRKKGLEHAKRDMDMMAQLGGAHIAAPPSGAQQTGGIELLACAERYHALCEVGRQTGVIPQVEVWGFSKQLNRLGEAIFVATESGHADACVLADPYHLYKGGSPFEGLKLLTPSCLRHFHINDYPAAPPREKIGDEHRVYPGDGTAPLDHLFQILRDTGYTGMISLELFNKTLYQQDPAEVAKTGLAKTRAAVQRALG